MNRDLKASTYSNTHSIDGHYLWTRHLRHTRLVDEPGVPRATRSKVDRPVDRTETL